MLEEMTMKRKRPEIRTEAASSLRQASLGEAPCAFEVTCLSERSRYVNQDYVLRTVGRPHRAINIMHCYYPLHPKWPGRASEVMPRTGDFVWDYEYDDYPPYLGGLKGRTDSEPFTLMRDIRRHGQDVMLTLTVDPTVSDAHLVKVARELKPYGRVFLRINHEADGNWFTFNRTHSYKEVGLFFERFHNIVKEHAANVLTVGCIGGLNDKGEWERGTDLHPYIRAADIWSVDRYLTLHWGWPFGICETDGSYQKYATNGLERCWGNMCRAYEAFVDVCKGREKPLVLSELNADADGEGHQGQAKMVRAWYDRVLSERPRFLKALTFYQFRDFGGLGLEMNDPNNRDVGVPAPFLQDYKAYGRHPYFSPRLQEGKKLKAKGLYKLSWTHAEDAVGLAMRVKLKKRPKIFEVVFEDEVNLMIKVGDNWFYKAPWNWRVEVTSAFFELKPKSTETVYIFAPPASGANGDTDDPDRSPRVHRTVMRKPPRFRVRY